MGAEMHYTIKRDADELVVAVWGRLDATTVPQLEEALSSSLDGITNATFDLAHLHYISSAGLRILLSIYKRLSKAGGSLRIVNAGGSVLEILEASGFADIFTME